MQLVKIFLVRISNPIISFGIYYIFVVINPKLYILGNVVGFTESVANVYFQNSKFVFKKQHAISGTDVLMKLQHSSL